LKSAASFIRTSFAKRANMKVTPEIVFLEDKVIERGSRIFELLEKMKKEDGGETP